MTLLRWPTYSAAAGFLTVGLASFLVLHTQPGEYAPAMIAPVVAQAPATEVAAATTHVVQAPRATSPDAGYYDQLRTRLQWVQTRMGGTLLQTPDLSSRMLLAKSAAKRAGLADVGLSFKDVYGIINAETSWIPRMGASKNGTPNLGIAQFEPATAKALGLTNPEDPVEAIHVAALHMKQAAKWSEDRIEGLKLSAADRALKLREGVSIYYNLSTKGRNTWNGKNARKLPRETQLHIANARNGAIEAALIDAQLRTNRDVRTVASLASLQSGS